MTKRWAALLLALVIPLTLLISGCGSSPRLTTEEYYDELSDYMQRFMRAKYTVDVIIVYKDDHYLGDLTGFDSNCEEFLRVLDDFKEINPPDKYKEKHKELLKALDRERDWLKAVKRCTKCTTEEQFEKAYDEVHSFSNDAENRFLIKLMLFFSDLYEDLGIDPNEYI